MNKAKLHIIKSLYLKRDVELRIYLPEGLLGNEKLNLLLFNDGQEAEGLMIQETLEQLYDRSKIEPIVVVAISASADRLQEYGVSGMPDFLNRGERATAYSSFITLELLAFIQKNIPYLITGHRAIAGFSLGGLSAFDIAWNNDKTFDMVGVFSGSFWWRKKDLADGYNDDDRIAHQLIRNTLYKPDLKFFLMTGTEDEAADRNGNGIIDSIDDTVDVIKALLEKGYRRPQDIYYYEMLGGQHNVATWAKILPAFLTWAFSRK